MKKRQAMAVMTAAMLLAAGTAMISHAAEKEYQIYVSNNYDTQNVSADDNDDEKVHPLAPDVYSDDYEIIDGPSWSKGLLSWTPVRR